MAQQNTPRKRGAPEGVRNGRYRHGRYSRVVRAQRRAEWERQQAEAEKAWPNKPLDYSKIIAELDRLRALRDLEPVQDIVLPEGGG
jgi:hypothetical protein